MSSPVWRAFALVAVLAAFTWVCVQQYVGTPATYGDLGATAVTSGVFRLGSVSADSELARAGFRTGERVRWANWSPATRGAATEPMPGSRATLVAENGHRATLVARAIPHQNLPMLLDAIRLAFLFVAGFLVVRRWQERAVRSLSLSLGCFGLGLALSASAPVVSPEVSFALFMFGNLALLIVAVAAAADFSAHVTGTPHPVERRLATLTAALAVVAIVARGTAELIPTLDKAAVLRTPLGLLGSAPFVLAIATIIAGYVETTGADRIRKRWVLWIMGIGLFGPAIDLVIGAIFGYNATLDQAALVTLAIVPIGLAYVILRHRLIDVGFVLNQAAVFAGVSLVVVGVVAIVEYLLSRYVESVSHVTSTAVQIAVALALGFSINAIHKRVDRFVDQVFFRKRHEAEASLRAFALDAPYYTNARVLLERALDAVLRHAQPVHAGIWMKDERTPSYALRVGDLPPVLVDVDDPALVAMRARHVVVDVHAARSALPGALAFPMTGGGELLGVLVCAAKRDEEAYAPDETAALEAVAEAVAHAWAVLRTQELEREVERLRGPARPSGATEGAMEAI
jgi:GAF domain-containing protein